MFVAEHLKQPTRATGLKTDFEPGCPARGRPYLVLLPVGFTVPALLPTRAVRSYRTLSPLLPHAGACFGGLLSVALSLGSPPAAVSRHRVSMEPGLSSATAHAHQAVCCNSDRPADWSGAYRTLIPLRQVDREQRTLVGTRLMPTSGPLVIWNRCCLFLGEQRRSAPLNITRGTPAGLIRLSPAALHFG